MLSPSGRARSGRATSAMWIRRVLADYVLAPVWRSLMAYGAMFVGHVDQRADSAALYGCYGLYRGAGWSDWPATPWLSERLLLSPGLRGLPEGHPERLCKGVPLSEAEQQLARELWPGHRSGGRGPTQS
ncbi:DUF6059 family protein [Streptomyces sp. NBC_00986]|uniref:DUF6059 family protein n=1 Tax=Streptomyces sp. NBC_00986 TaxID=2903702 RepID=UPI00386E48ED|nr:hypothetical protein OG504_00370 [Streptomyces sp. NBC_00986]WSX64491.1 hypothetical protein OG504_52380 [Streptomyces sp. NBC_00986]